MSGCPIDHTQLPSTCLEPRTEGTPIAARPPSHHAEEAPSFRSQAPGSSGHSGSASRKGHTCPCPIWAGASSGQVNTLKAANFAHLNDLALLHLVLRRHYVPISCQETQAPGKTRPTRFRHRNLPSPLPRSPDASVRMWLEPQRFSRLSLKMRFSAA